jgi:hypothetical protein
MTDEPVLFMTDNEISEGAAAGASPVARLAKRLRIYSTVVQPNHVEATEASHRLHRDMLKLLLDQLVSKRLVPATGVLPGYQPPSACEASVG